MKKTFLTMCLLLACATAMAQWKPAGSGIVTKWGEKLDPQNVWPEYPRPQLERADWQNLNGLWDYAIRPLGETPTAYDGKILVPFAVESSLSGVGKTVGSEKELWYHRTFTIPAAWKGKDVLLNFGAVDYRADVILNGDQIFTHKGGYAPFSVNITPFLKEGAQDLVVRVFDANEKSDQACGKQCEKPEGIWYTPVTGIWQTVWIEPVNESYIASLRMVPDVDGRRLQMKLETENARNTLVRVQLSLDGKKVASTRGYAQNDIYVSVPDMKLWSPESPTLYDVEIVLTSRDGKELDKVKSYTAFRKVDKVRDATDVYRFRVNGKKVFMLGPLDQGWWPDGLYTAPSDEALRFDIEKTKEWGFNMIRKHVKVEPARWYYWADKLGVYVWQDMPSSDRGGYWDKDDNEQKAARWAPRDYEGGIDRPRSETSKANYYHEWKEIMDFCYSFPSVVVWVPFNEGWGQFDTEAVTNWTKAYDPSRLVDPASGGNHIRGGDILDMHHYPNPKRMYMYDNQRIMVLGEYGGIGRYVDGHMWNIERKWGYVKIDSKEDATNEYVKYARELEMLIPRGYSAGVYTQTTDVEGEMNGLMTYDRKVMKMDEKKIRAINQEVINSLK